MLLRDYLRTYLLEHDLSAGYVKHLHHTATEFDAFIAAKPLEEITAEDVNRWAESLTGRLAKRTVRNKLAGLMTLLRGATDDGVCPPLAGRVKHIRVRCAPVRAFTPEEISRLLQAAAETPGWFGRTGIRRSDWWVAIIHAAWDTALRIGDLLELEWRDFREADGSAVLLKTQSKTGRPIAVRLRPETWAAIQKIRGQGQPREQVFPWMGWRNKFSAAFRRVACAAGVDGSPKFLRRARATAECRLHGPAAAAKVLGHADGTGTLAWKNYIDRSQLTDDLPMPPPIGSP